MGCSWHDGSVRVLPSRAFQPLHYYSGKRVWGLRKFHGSPLKRCFTRTSNCATRREVAMLLRPALAVHLNSLITAPYPSSFGSNASFCAWLLHVGRTAAAAGRQTTA